jgi:hypothetical protein
MDAVNWQSVVMLDQAWTALGAMFVVVFICILIQGMSQEMDWLPSAFVAFVLAGPVIAALYVFVKFVKWAWLFQFVAEQS